MTQELLSAVLGTDIATFKIEGETVTYNDHYVTNIYKLAHKCKEWARTQGYDIFSGYNSNTGHYNAYVYTCFTEEWEKWLASPRSDTEPDAIFKACDYILKEMK